MWRAFWIACRQRSVECVDTWPSDPVAHMQLEIEIDRRMIRTAAGAIAAQVGMLSTRRRTHNGRVGGAVGRRPRSKVLRRNSCSWRGHEYVLRRTAPEATDRRIATRVGPGRVHSRPHDRLTSAQEMLRAIDSARSEPQLARTSQKNKRDPKKLRNAPGAPRWWQHRRETEVDISKLKVLQPESTHAAGTAACAKLRNISAPAAATPTHRGCSRGE